MTLVPASSSRSSGGGSSALPFLYPLGYNGGFGVDTTGNKVLTHGSEVGVPFDEVYLLDGTVVPSATNGYVDFTAGGLDFVVVQAGWYQMTWNLTVNAPFSDPTAVVLGGGNAGVRVSVPAAVGDGSGLAGVAFLYITAGNQASLALNLTAFAADVTVTYAALTVTPLASVT